MLQGALVVTAVTAEGTPVAGSLMQGAQLAANLVNLKYGRDAEREADFYGTRILAQAGYDPHAAVTLQETFLKLSEGASSSWAEGLFASHPPSAERVANNRGLVETLRREGFTSGEYGADAYQAAIRQLKRDAEAYKLHDQATESDHRRQLRQGPRSDRSAIERRMRKPAFHGMRGEIRLRQKRYDDALTNFDRAIDRDRRFLCLLPGARHDRSAALGQKAGAKSDLNASVELLPTTIAYLELGKIAESEGDREAAARYYDAAGQSQGPVGEEARARRARLAR